MIKLNKQNNIVEIIYDIFTYSHNGAVQSTIENFFVILYIRDTQNKQRDRTTTHRT